MANTKMLQILIDGQVEIKKEMKGGFKKVYEEIKKTNKRLDTIGKTVAYLEDLPAIATLKR
jgi:hypothetical protein